MLLCLLVLVAGFVGCSREAVREDTLASPGTAPVGARLAALTIAGATLTPAFSPDVTEYRVHVHAMSGVPFRITPTAESSGATITVDGVPIESGTTTAAIPLREPVRPVEIGIRAATGHTARYVLVASVAQEAYVKASNTRADQRFGIDISLSGDLLAVGAWGEASNGTGENDTSAPNAGAVYVYVRRSGVWTQEAYLKAPYPRAGSYFGISVSIDGDTLAVGAQEESSAAIGIDGDGTNVAAPEAGAAYVFRRKCLSSIRWELEAYIKPSNTRPGAWFGTAVALKGNTLAVGSWGESSGAVGVNGNQADTTAPGAGAAYVFTR
jgi:hypothetical protein